MTDKQRDVAADVEQAMLLPTWPVATHYSGVDPASSSIATARRATARLDIRLLISRWRLRARQQMRRTELASIYSQKSIVIDCSSVCAARTVVVGTASVRLIGLLVFFVAKVKARRSQV